MLLKHTDLCRRYRLEIKISEAVSTVPEEDHGPAKPPIYHERVSYLSFMDKFPLFRIEEGQMWYKMADLDEIVDGLELQDEQTVDVSVVFLSPDGSDPFECAGVGENPSESKVRIKGGDNVRTHLRGILKAYQLYVTVEFER